MIRMSRLTPKRFYVIDSYKFELCFEVNDEFGPRTNSKLGLFNQTSKKNIAKEGFQLKTLKLDPGFI